MTVNIRAASSHRPSSSTFNLMEQLEPRWLASVSHYHTGTAVSYRHRQPAVVAKPIWTVRYGHHYRALPPENSSAAPLQAGAAATMASGTTLSAAPRGGYTGTTSGRLGDGIPDYIYDPRNGDLSFTSDGLPHTVAQVHVYSTSGKLLTSMPREYVETVYTGIRTLDLGNILPPDLTINQLLGDLTLHYSWSGQGFLPGYQSADLIVADAPVGTPPPLTNPPPGQGMTPPGGATGTTLGVLGDGKPDYVYESSTGNLRFTSDGLPHSVGEVDAFSASGKFTSPKAGAYSVFSPLGIVDLNLGTVLPAHLTSDDLLGDLTLHYTWIGQGIQPPWSDADLIIA
jgi:hypothetical protein